MVLNWLPSTEQTSLTTHEGYYDDDDHTGKSWIAEILLIFKQTSEYVAHCKNQNHEFTLCWKSQILDDEKQTDRVTTHISVWESKLWAHTE